MNNAAQNFQVFAGSPSPVEDGQVFDLASHLVRHPQDTFYVNVCGDSMVDAGILPGDILIVDRALEPKPSDIVVAQVGDGFTVKRFVHEKGKLRLVPASSEHKPIDIGEDSRICGVVTFAIHKF